MEVTTTYTKAGKFDARFYHLVLEEEIGRVKGHFGPINNLKFHPDGKRLVVYLLIVVVIHTSQLAATAVEERTGTYVCIHLTPPTLILTSSTKHVCWCPLQLVDVALIIMALCTSFYCGGDCNDCMNLYFGMNLAKS